MASSKTTSGVTMIEGKGLKTEARLFKVRSTLKAHDKYAAQNAFDKGATDIEASDAFVEFKLAAQKILDTMWKKAKKDSK